MTNEKLVESIAQEGRTISLATVGDEALGPFSLLPGTWKNQPNHLGHGDLPRLINISP